MEAITIAAMQLPLAGGEVQNIAAVSDMVVAAVDKGAEIILPPELFSGPYFCTLEDEALFALAHPVSEHPSVKAMQKLAKDKKVAIPTSFFERDGQHHYNSLAMIGADGEIMGVYRKSHIPDGPGYEEKFYFRPGNTGFKVWDVFGTKIGVGICWDQWYPECARAMALMGAELLFYPTAIGSEPYDAALNTADMWQRVMQGHAAANAMPVIASNRIGSETDASGNSQSYYGHSFITNEKGDKIAEYGADEEGILVASIDLKAARLFRAGMGFFRDRRPELYGRLVEDI
ncbi:N-carbamoylputrescine amidase [Alterisphingorhabdus coralli]|uniref:N-carbamoylputrescine amidase n=1 Tax=Alterisphingorhabdus coralli TaxID=3071408 RepID=A0AA97F8Q9_9SPHN|nr:N-carbamoylputrescine amidase [Parasphingorhabdus sp. SCSIO 66989]WOE76033.1 N-carbamoylputrescine amidase [Parasphingorhabdus sp. SCSIO 66989]